MLRKAWTARLFQDEEIILDWLAGGDMTVRVCEQLIHGEREFRRMQWAEKYGQAHRIKKWATKQIKRLKKAGSP